MNIASSSERTEKYTTEVVLELWDAEQKLPRDLTRTEAQEVYLELRPYKAVDEDLIEAIRKRCY